MKIGINVCILNDGKGKENLTGIGYYTYQIVKNLIHYDNDNYYYLFTFYPLFVEFEKKDNYEIVVIPSYTQKKLLWTAFTLSTKLKKYPLDAFWDPAFILPLYMSKRVKSFVTIHDLANFIFKGISKEGKTLLKIKKYFIGKACRKADKIISVSEATKTDIEQMFQIAPEKITVIYQGGNWDDSGEEKKEDAYSPYSQPYFLYVGTLQPRKNIETIIRAFERYKEKCKSETKLVFAGGIGWGMEGTLCKVEQSTFKDDIVLEGRVSEERKNVLYRNALALVFPSLYEGFGVPVLEAFHFNTLVITARNSALPEVGGEAAFYIDDARDIETLSQLMHRVRNMGDDERKTRIDAGRRQAEKFTWYNCAMEIKDVITKLNRVD